MKLDNEEQLTKKYVNTLMIKDGEIHYLPYLIGVSKKNKSFYNYKDVININDVYNYLTDKMKRFMELSNTVLIKNSNGFIPYNIDKNLIIEHSKLHNLINK